MTFRRAVVLLPALFSLLLVPFPAVSAEEVTFADTRGALHEDAVSALATRGIVRGCTDDRFCAQDHLTRGQVASIIVRALDLPPASDEVSGRFRDTAGTAHRDAIDALAESGLTSGCAEDRFCPQDPITRDQLATLLRRAFDVPDAPAQAHHYFVDVSGVHAASVASIAEAGISNGCDLVSFCPSDHLQRGHAAMFFARSLDLVDRVGLAPFAERDAEHQARLAAERQAAEARAAAERKEAEARAAAAVQTRASKAVEVATAQVGKPYAWGGNGPNSFDCSGLTSFAWASAGVTLPRTSRAQYAATTRISRSELRPGDLVFYYSPISHVAMYIGDGRVVEAPNRGNNVRIRQDGLTRSGVVGFGRP